MPYLEASANLSERRSVRPAQICLSGGGVRAALGAVGALLAAENAYEEGAAAPGSVFGVSGGALPLVEVSLRMRGVLGQRRADVRTALWDSAERIFHDGYMPKKSRLIVNVALTGVLCALLGLGWVVFVVLCGGPFGWRSTAVVLPACFSIGVVARLAVLRTGLIALVRPRGWRTRDLARLNSTDWRMPGPATLDRDWHAGYVDLVERDIVYDSIRSPRDLREMTVGDVLRALTAHPIIFSPFVKGERMLADGGMIDNLALAGLAKSDVDRNDLIVVVDSSQRPKDVAIEWDGLSRRVRVVLRTTSLVCLTGLAVAFLLEGQSSGASVVAAVLAGVLWFVAGKLIHAGGLGEVVNWARRDLKSQKLMLQVMHQVSSKHRLAAVKSEYGSVAVLEVAITDGGDIPTTLSPLAPEVAVRILEASYREASKALGIEVRDADLKKFNFRR